MLKDEHEASAVKCKYLQPQFSPLEQVEGVAVDETTEVAHESLGQKPGDRVRQQPTRWT